MLTIPCPSLCETLPPLLESKLIGRDGDTLYLTEALRMTDTVINLLMLVLVTAGAIFLVFGPLTAMGFMLWHWKKELDESARLRQVRSTQVR